MKKAETKPQEPPVSQEKPQEEPQEKPQEEPQENVHEEPQEESHLLRNVSGLIIQSTLKALKNTSPLVCAAVESVEERAQYVGDHVGIDHIVDRIDTAMDTNLVQPMRRRVIKPIHDTFKTVDEKVVQPVHAYYDTTRQKIDDGRKIVDEKVVQPVHVYYDTTRKKIDDGRKIVDEKVVQPVHVYYDTTRKKIDDGRKMVDEKVVQPVHAYYDTTRKKIDDGRKMVDEKVVQPVHAYYDTTRKKIDDGRKMVDEKVVQPVHAYYDTTRKKIDDGRKMVDEKVVQPVHAYYDTTRQKIDDGRKIVDEKVVGPVHGYFEKLVVQPAKNTVTAGKTMANDHLITPALDLTNRLLDHVLPDVPVQEDTKEEEVPAPHGEMSMKKLERRALAKLRTLTLRSTETVKGMLPVDLIDYSKKITTHAEEMLKPLHTKVKLVHTTVTEYAHKVHECTVNPVLSILDPGAFFLSKSKTIDSAAFREAMSRTPFGPSGTLEDFARHKRILLVLTRHCGCPFFREALSDLHGIHSDVEARGVRIVVVYRPGTLKDEEIQRIFADYHVEHLPHVADVDGLLYGALGLRSGTPLQIAGPYVIYRSLRALMWGGHGLPSLTTGDVTLMPGVFLVDNGEVTGSFVHTTAADRPNYVDLL